MASAPLFKQRKSKTTPRARIVDDDPSMDVTPTPGQETPAPQEDDSTISPAALKAKIKSRTSKKKVDTRLSFDADPEQDDDAGVGAFKLKKSMLSRKLMQKSAPSTPSPGTPVSSQASPRYDDEYLKQLKASTPQSRTSLATYSESSESGISVNPEDVARLNITTPDDEGSTVIPSDSSIKAAKERRGRMKVNGDSEDYISLSLTRRTDVDDGPHPESRLVREEDELGEGDDEFAEYTSAQDRIAIGKKSRRVEADKNRASMREMIEDAEEEDEETMEWEQEQLRRGGHRASEASSPPVKQEYRPAPIPEPVPLPTLNEAVSRLTQHMTTLTASHVEKTKSLATLSQEKEQYEKREVELRDMVNRAEDKRSFFVAFRDWVESVAAFLDEKFPLLEKLEEEHFSILKERSKMISNRRQSDDEDDLATFLPVERSTANQSEELELDEFGRTRVQPTPASRRADRLARRAQRQLRTTKASDAEEGYSTDSSLPPPEHEAYGAALSRLRKDARSILADVRASEFKDPSKEGGLATWYGKWRSQWEESYVNAWGGLGLIGAWEFWVRLEIVSWDPIEDRRSFDSFKWFQSLYEYSRPRDDGEGMDTSEIPLGPDGDLVSAMISTTLIPRACKTIEGGALDAYSDKQVRRAIDFVEEVEASIEPDNAKFQLLLKTIFNVFSAAVSESEAQLQSCTSAGIQPSSFNPESVPARRRILARQSRLLSNILRWRRLGKDRLNLDALITRQLRVITMYAETGWDVGGEEFMQKVRSSLPPGLVSQ